MEAVDTLILPRWLIPVEPDDRVLLDHALAVRHGRIVGVLPADEAKARFQADEVIELPRHAVTPGLINAHTHTPMTLLRGLADDLPLMTWLNEHIWPAEQTHVSPEFVHDGSSLAMAEMLLSGTTCINDMYFFPEVTARVASGMGMRASIGMILIDFPSAYGEGPDDYIEKGLKLHDSYRTDPLISTVFAPHAPYTVSEPHLRRVRTLANELDAPIHIHLHETAFEVEESLKHTGKRPLQNLHDMGLLGPDFIAVHMTQLTDGEIAQLADFGASVVHCPESNLKLASGLCPVAKLIEAGVNVALGTDGAASNNDLDMLGEMRTAALLAKGVSGDAAAVPAYQALRMATINGARAVGLAEETGSLVEGKAADIIAVELDRLETMPVYAPLSHLVYGTHRDQVSDVWVGGRHLVKNRELTHVNTGEIMEKCAQWRAKILKSDNEHKG